MQHTKCIATNNIANAKIYFSKRDKAIFEGFEGDVFPSFTHSRDFWRIKANVNILSDWKPFRYSASLHLRINRGRVPIKVTLNVQYFSKRNKRDIYIQFKRSCLLLIYSALYLSSYVLMWFQLATFYHGKFCIFLEWEKEIMVYRTWGLNVDMKQNEFLGDFLWAELFQIRRWMLELRFIFHLYASNGDFIYLLSFEQL